MIDIKGSQGRGPEGVRQGRTEKAKAALIRQMRVVEQAEQALRSEKIKLADIEQQIADGTL